jgi:DNA-binding transcriptional LysR family regulator
MIRSMVKRHAAPFDLNLLLVLDALMRERSVTAAGQSVGLSQPSMSNALRRLRALCGDPLFVRTRDGMQPTPEAERLAGPVQQALNLFQAGLQGGLAFDPSTSRRSFRILLSDVGEIAVLPRLSRLLAEGAPGVTIESVARRRDGYLRALENGEADLAVACTIPRAPGLRRRHLFTDRYVCLARRDHPRIRGALTAETFREESHIGVGPPGSDGDALGRAATLHRLDLRIGMRVAHFVTAAIIVANGDMLVTVPHEIVAELEVTRSLQVLPLPLSLPDFTVQLYWHPRYHSDQANQWLRKQLVKACSDV